MEGITMGAVGSATHRGGEIPPWPDWADALDHVQPLAEVGRTWRAVRLDDVPNLLGSLFATSDLWLEVIHIEVRFLQEPSSSGLRGRADVAVRGTLPPEFPPGGYLPSCLLIDYLHSYRDWADAMGEAASSLYIGANRGGMFWRIMNREEVGRPDPVL